MEGQETSMRPAMDAPSNMKFWRAQLEYLIGIASGDGTFKVISYFDEGKGTRDQMKYMFASDIHGSAWYCRRLLEEYRRSGADRLILLGDILYHGPRNDLPKEYAPKEVIAMLNAIKSQIIAVRGNCEAEVDQMVLEFPVMADYGFLVLNGLTFYATHGHVYHPENLPPMKKGDILIYGHTHLLRAETFGDYYVVNPGSVSIPKGGNPATYGILEEKVFKILDFEGNTVKTLTF